MFLGCFMLAEPPVKDVAAEPRCLTCPFQKLGTVRGDVIEDRASSTATFRTQVKRGDLFGNVHADLAKQAQNTTCFRSTGRIVIAGHHDDGRVGQSIAY